MSSETDTAQAITVSIPKASIGPFAHKKSPEERKEPQTVKPKKIYEAMYGDVNEFLRTHSKVLTAQAMNVADSYSIEV